MNYVHVFDYFAERWIAIPAPIGAKLLKICQPNWMVGRIYYGADDMLLRLPNSFVLHLSIVR